MSDYSDYRDREEDSAAEESEDQDELDYEDDPQQYRYRDHDDDESGEDDPDHVDNEEGEETPEPKVDKQNLKLCPDHESGKMTRSCSTCAAALSLITNKEIIKELCSGSKESSLSSRYAGHCDTIVPTLDLDPDTIKLAENIFSKGVWRDSKLFPDIVRKYLTLPAEQHERLNADLKMEDVLRKFKKEKRFKAIFDYQKDLMESLRHLRVVQKPLFASMERVNLDLGRVRTIGEKAGIKYPDSAPIKSDAEGVHVPRVGHAVPDQLKYSEFDGFFPRPDIHKFVQENGLDLNAANAAIDLIEKYRADMSKQFMDLFDTVAASLNATEDYLMFYSNIYTMVDSSLRELLRNKSSNLFRRDIKSEILDHTSSKKMEKKPTGLFGG